MPISIGGRDGTRQWFVCHKWICTAASYEETRYNSGSKLDTDDRGLTRTEVALKCSVTVSMVLKRPRRYRPINLRSGDWNHYNSDFASWKRFVRRGEKLSRYSQGETLLELSKRNIKRALPRSIKDIQDKRAKVWVVTRIMNLCACCDGAIFTNRCSNNLFWFTNSVPTLIEAEACCELGFITFDYALLPSSAQVALEQAVENHPEIQASLLDIDAARKEMRRERGLLEAARAAPARKWQRV